MAMTERRAESLERSADEEVLAAACADLNEECRPEEQWLTVTATAIRIVGANGDVVRRFPIAEMRSIRAMSHVGSGQVIGAFGTGADAVGTDTVVLARYTLARAARMEQVVHLVQGLIEGRPPEKERLADSARKCPRCGKPVRAVDNRCERCSLPKGKIVLRLLQYARPYRWKMAAAAVVLIFAALLELVPPYLTKVMIDDVLRPLKFDESLLILVVVLAGTRLLLLAMQWVRGLLGVWVGARMMSDIRSETYRKLMDLSLSFFDRRQTTQFISRVNQDSEAMRQFLTDGVIWLASQVLMVAAILTVMFGMDWRLTLFALMPLPLLAALSIAVWPRFRSLWYRQWRAVNRINVLVGDALQGFRVVKAFGQEAAEKRRYREANHDLMRQTVRMDTYWQGLFPMYALISSSGALMIWYFGGQQVLREDLSLGTLMAFIAYLMMFFGPLQWFSQALSWSNKAIAAADRVFEILDTDADIADSPAAAPVDRIAGRVSFEGVGFGYQPYRPVLKGIDFQVEPGEMIGLVGHSGAGKSTLIHLLCRFYDPNEGKIRIDGMDVKDFRLADLRRMTGVVLQETFLFDGTIADNIAYAKPGASAGEIIRAAKIANAHDFIARLPDGYDTGVGERGHRLSGGEKQRIAIARAILHDPAILILDEATASVDTETERQIQQALSRLVRGRTTFAIAHRLSTLRSAGRLVVLERGRIAEIGTHEQLLERKGAYFRLLEAQQEPVMRREEGGRPRQRPPEPPAGEEGGGPSRPPEMSAGEEGGGPSRPPEMSAREEGGRPCRPSESSAGEEEMRVLDPATVSFFRNAGGVLHAEVEGTVYPELLLLRCFPLSDANRFLSLRTGEGKELGLLADLAQFARDSRRAVEQELKLRYFVPKVERVEKIRQRPSLWIWDVQTDHGPLRLRMRNIHEHVKTPAPGRMVLNDPEGTQCEIADITRLDAHSRKELKKIL